MIRILLFLMFCCGFQMADAQNDSINRKDSQNKKQGLWIYFGADRPDLDYPNEGKVEEGRYVDDRKEGTWIKYWDDGETAKLIGNYTNNRPGGEYWKYHRNGELMEHGEFSKNQFKGFREKFDSTGQLLLKTKYNDGRMIDTSFIYFANGCLEAMEIMDDQGVPRQSFVYSKDSCNQIVEIVTQHPHGNSQPAPDFSYKKDSILVINSSYHGQGTWRYHPDYVYDYSDQKLCSDQPIIVTYNEMNEVIFKGSCKDGKLNEGKLYLYDNDGILLRIEIWDNGIFIKEGRF